MKYKKPIAVILIVIIVVWFLVYFFSMRANNSSKIEEASAHTYINSVHGFSLSYPSSLQSKEYLDTDVVFGHISGENVDGVVDARVMTVEGEAGKTLLDVVSSQLINLCAADGPSITFSCTKVSQEQPVTTDSGIEGHVIYLDGELRDLKTNKVTKVGKGPYFIFPLSTSATASKVVVVHPPLNQTAEEADSQTIREIALSLQLTKNETGKPSIEEYVSKNISNLSPIKEQLGGKFYLTSIEAHGGEGIVEYEDGHNAYTADFTYKTDESGKVSVTSFKIRQ